MSKVRRGSVECGPRRHSRPPVSTWPSVICGAAPRLADSAQAVCERSLIINREHAELDETDVVTFQDETCQLAGGKGTGIDVDAISADVRFNHGRVAVDNRFFVSAFMH